MHPFRAAVALALALVCFACGPKDPANPGATVIHLDAPAAVNVGAGAYAKLTVTGQSSGLPIQDGSTVTFETDVGSFSADDSQSSTDVTVAGHAAVAKLYAPTYPGVAHVTAKFVDAYSNLFKATATVTFKTSSLATHINFSCTSRNLGAFWDGVGAFGVKCTAVPEDENNEAVAGAHVQFLTEAGGFTPTDTPGTFLYDPNLGGRQPVDVDPNPGEPSWVDASAPGTPTRNPRDGLVTLVAYVEGDSQGLFSTPYVDKNDNDKYDPGEDLPPGVTTYEDTQDKYVWKQIKILWTGPIADTPPNGTRVTPTPLTATGPLARGQSRIYTWTILDTNLNVVAANDQADAVNFTLGGDVPDGVAISPASVAVNHSMGLDLDADFKINNPTSAASYSRDATYQVTISNNRAATDVDGDKVVSIGADVAHNIATDDSGVSTDSEDETLPVVEITVQ